MAYAREKDRKLKFQAQLLGGMEPPPPTQPIARAVAGTSATDQESSQEELLQQITNQLESLSINLVQGVRAPQSGNDCNHQEGQRQTREYVCYNCGEVGHGMYFCPHPRRYQGNGNHRRAPRQQVTPPRARPPNGQQNAPVTPPIQILKPPPPPPQTPAEIPPLPSGGEDRAISVISLDNGKGKEKMEEAVAMPIKRVRRQKTDDMEASEAEKGHEGSSQVIGDKKRKCRSRRHIGVEDFPLGVGSTPYDLISDVSKQGPKISRQQLLHLSPKMRRTWSKMVSTRRAKTKAIGSISARGMKDIMPVIDAEIKSQRVSKVYMDGGAEICVMTEKLMHRLGLEVNEQTSLQAKMANNVRVACVGKVNGMKVSAFGVAVSVDAFGSLKLATSSVLVLAIDLCILFSANCQVSGYWLVDNSRLFRFFVLLCNQFRFLVLLLQSVQIFGSTTGFLVLVAGLPLGLKVVRPKIPTLQLVIPPLTDIMERYPMQQHVERSSQDMNALGQQPGVSMLSRLKETLRRATRSKHATNEINKGVGEVVSPFTSQIDSVLSESIHVSTPATTPIGLSKLTPSETLLSDGRSLAEVQEMERYILAAREKENESLRKAEQHRAILAKALMTSAIPYNLLS
ncbi:hypothetical protein L7F22_030556 [Adiantum nelumboides]|nr:hypothetical protein [Adiantum nelumboides]